VKTTLDHIVIACADLEQGTAWLRDRLGVDPQPGGKHAAMGTHNKLLRLGSRDYLELLAIDADAEAPAHTRWMGMDERGIRERAAREPFLLTWVASTDDLDEAVARVPELGEIREASRGALRWRIALPDGGGLAYEGVMPTLLQWDGAHPCDLLEDRGCELVALGLRHPSASEIAMTLQVLEYGGWDAVETGPSRIEATLRTPSGTVVL
jgi:catechol 2,3-dioxygenase-like lactoylglutathione lyase family enzyme